MRSRRCRSGRPAVSGSPSQSMSPSTTLSIAMGLPVQGVRPVFSSVADILEAHGQAPLRGRPRGRDRITLAYDVEARALTCRVGDRPSSCPTPAASIRIRESSPMDKIANVVHEAGHAVMYAVLGSRTCAPPGGSRRAMRQRVSPRHTRSMRPPVAHPAGQGRARRWYRRGWSSAGLASVGRSADREPGDDDDHDSSAATVFDHEFQANYMLGNEYSMDRTVP